jgi:glutaredoxin
MKKTGILLFLALSVVVLTGCSRPLIPIKGNSSQMSPEQIKINMETFINESLMQPGMKAEIKDVVMENGLYKMTVSLGAGQEITSYATKDGKIFFPESMNIEEIQKKVQEMKDQQQNETQKTNAEIPKNDKPTVDLYVMSFCPFGNKAEDTLKSVYALLKNKVNFNFHYIVNTDGDTIQSLHGEKEVAQDEREACVLKNYGKDKWFSFVSYVNTNCGSDGACWETAAKNSGLSATSISACVSSQGVNLMKENEKAATAANASGSPTMLINGVSTQAVYQYGNSESYKQAICGAFNKAPTECSKVLTSQTSATATQGGSCAN